MSRTPKAITQLPPSTLAAIEKLGADLAVARLRRKESLASWAKRMGVSISTLQRLEAGDPTISVGIVASALWLMSRDGALAELAAPAHDRGAIELEVREAEELGRARARASQEARTRATVNKARKSGHALR
jgi:transcriptional regulator with XRE-family HTH domain